MCGKDLGGIWVDGANDSKTYIPVKCNAGHSKFSTYPDQHFYYDVKSGFRIIGGEDPEVTVDSRGCIKEHG